MAEGTRVTVEIEEAKQELALLLTRLDEKSLVEKGCARDIASARHELANLRSMYECQRKAYNDAQSRLRFLKLPDSDTFGDSSSFRGDVIFVIHASIPRLIHAHRFILAGRSSVFNRMFEAGMLEEQTGRIHINDASYATMRAVVNYCYTAEISFDETVLPQEVLKVAHKYDIPLLRKICDEELCERINQANLADMLRLCRMYDAHKLQREAMKYFKKNFDMVQDSVLDNLIPIAP
ncbi:hypothetical protein MPTK1_8g01920 [Marchantia polymorpha subsp. ruderalis]|nr:hypothetical protein MARPO_0064s0008 [Marchantia polymorpha]BBN18358.1 hypothetical protein Mp_8g01920 [Marchantia polymorpha subsp. ruderalis]|eukprot:PTQ36315.1 hypothetical protein MARPO_0064s0008 [Marchantia polymorpha]